MANSVDPDQTAPIGAVCSVVTLFASILNLSVNASQLFAADNFSSHIFRCIFLPGALRVKFRKLFSLCSQKECWLSRLEFTGFRRSSLIWV